MLGAENMHRENTNNKMTHGYGVWGWGGGVSDDPTVLGENMTVDGAAANVGTK